MPNITLIREHLFNAIGKQYTDKEFDELCFEFGVEVDDVEKQTIEFTADGSKAEHIVYVIAIPANRYDLLCIEGFARALRIFLSLEAPPDYKLVEPTGGRQQLTVEAATASIRPFAACAILRGIKFDVNRYKSFIDLQEKLHQNICRRRTYVAIGTHDLDTLQGPFRYRALSPDEISFTPLTENDGKVFSSKELLNFYREDPSAKHLKPYTDIIFDSPVYPVIYDSADRVLSLPPIINGKHSRIQLHTTNVLIECTGTDITKVNIVLDTVVTMFSEYCAEPFTVEPVDVVYESTGEKAVTPLLSRRTCDAKLDEINGTIGIDISPEQACNLSNRMQLGPAEYISESRSIRVHVPPTRSDVLHAVDVIEDIAIAYGFNNIATVIPSTQTVGAPLPVNLFTDLLRSELAQAGYMEMLTHGLCSTVENFTYLRRPVGPAVSLSNPVNAEYEVVRTTLIPGALKTLSYNKSISHKDGVKLFEISDVVLPDDSVEVGAVNARRLVAVHAANTAGFEIIHGLVDRVMTCVQIRPEDKYAANSLTAAEIGDRKRIARAGVCYSVEYCEDPLFFTGMGVRVILHVDGSNAKEPATLPVGVFGVVHPEVLNSYDITYPCSLAELDIDALMLQ